MRGIHSVVDDLRRQVFTEVARLAYEGGDFSRIDALPYKIIPGEDAQYRHDVFLERAIVTERLRLACGLPLRTAAEISLASDGIEEAAKPEKYYEPPLINIIPFACNACPPKEIRVSSNCQGCLSHPCMNSCPKGAIVIGRDGKSSIDQSKCVKCGRCLSQCPYNAISRIERPCAKACGMDAIGSDEKGRAKIDYDKCVSCGMCLVNCPFAAIADKSQIFQLIQAINKGDEIIACVAPAFVGQFGKEATPRKLKKAMRILGFADTVEVAIGADLCTVEEAHDFLDNVPSRLDFMGTSCCPAWSVMAKKLFPEFTENISMALTPMVITARLMKKEHPNARIVFVGPCAAKKLEEKGAIVEEFDLSLVEYAIPAYYVIACAEASSNLARFDGVKYGYRTEQYDGLHNMYKKTRSEGFGAEAKRRIMLGSFVLSSGYYDAYYLKALRTKALIKQAFDKAFEKYDVILGPAAPTTAPKLGASLSDPLKMYLGDIYTISVNLAGLPGITLPCGTDQSGLPIGLQLIGDCFAEKKIIRAAYTYEQTRSYEHSPLAR